MSDDAPSARATAERVRLDRWLWAARFFRTRAQAKAAIEGGHVQVAPLGRGSASAFTKPKPSKEVAVGDMLEIRRGEMAQVVAITGLSEQRGNATIAQTLYSETLDSIEARETERARRMMERAGLRVPAQRPSKRDRRELQKLKHGTEDTEDP